MPFEDLKAFELVIKVIIYAEKKYGVSLFGLLGDFLDLYGLSLYDKDDSFGDLAELYDREIDCANARLDEFDYLMPNAKKVYIEGNHEFRLIKYLKKFAGPLKNRISIPGELKLNQRPKWTWVKYDKNQKYQIFNTDLYIRHEPFGSAQPKGQAIKAGDSFIYGHTHQIGEGHYVSKLSGKEIIAINSGALINFDARVFDYVKDRPDWKHAFTIVWIKGKKWHHQIIRISPEYTCIFDGKVFEL